SRIPALLVDTPLYLNRVCPYGLAPFGTGISTPDWQHLRLRKIPGTLTATALTSSHFAVAAGIWSVGGPLAVPWKQDVTLPCKVVGDPPPRVVWTYGDHSLPDDSRLSLSTDGGVRLLDAQRSNSGSYTCTSSNKHGSDSVTYLLRVIMPPSPPLLHVTETTTSSVRLQWTVQDDGGAPVTGATLYYRAAGGETLEMAMAANSHTVAGLKCGNLYHFFATVQNIIGSSESSEVVEARTKGRTPEPPPQFQFITSNSTQATLYLTQWENGGCDITHFKVQYRKLHSAHWATVSSEVGVVRTFAVGGLEPGERYEVRVTAYNSAGATPALYTVTTADLLHSAGEAYNSAGATATPALYTVTTADLLHSAGEAYNSAGATPALYTVTTADLLHSAGGSVLGQAGEGRWTGLAGGRSRAETNWTHRRFVLPAVVSTLALCLIAATAVICFHKRKSIPTQDEAKQKPSRSNSTKDYIVPCSEPTKGAPSLRMRDSKDDHALSPGDDVYQYASASYQFGRLSPPPPPCPPDPDNITSPTVQPEAGLIASRLSHQPESDRYPDQLLHEQYFQQQNRNDGFSAGVYHSPSLQDLTDASLYRSGSYGKVSGHAVLAADYGQTADRKRVDDRTLPAYQRKHQQMHPNSRMEDVASQRPEKRKLHSRDSRDHLGPRKGSAMRSLRSTSEENGPLQVEVGIVYDKPRSSKRSKHVERTRDQYDNQLQQHKNINMQQQQQLVKQRPQMELPTRGCENKLQDC
ncbi:Immunoglobulin I-set, partial [Trinorchestia longiramus]